MHSKEITVKRIYYYVLSNGGRWQLSREGGEDASFYGTKDAAIQAGRIVARTYGLMNELNTGLRIQRGNGTWEEERSYGGDPYPPPG